MKTERKCDCAEETGGTVETMIERIAFRRAVLGETEILNTWFFAPVTVAGRKFSEVSYIRFREYDAVIPLFCNEDHYKQWFAPISYDVFYECLSVLKASASGEPLDEASSNLKNHIAKYGLPAVWRQS